ncbi:Disintegrin and metalloproteinase domain-containing protein 5 [Apodemus speciosus]|uniref:Disintegrin and metalloproteinase domain-containing protein 5 n=1 Tax=Apodemus speciosus TaxID=105296 RepID=A0ABQ0FR68_APOSI
MILLFLLVVHLNGLQAGQNPQETILQTTVPEKITSPDVETDPENHMAYLITINESPHFIHLKKQIIYNFNCSGLYLRQKYGVQHSQSLSHLRGTIQFENVSYGIEPVETLSGFVHVIYKNTNEHAEISYLGTNQTYGWTDDLDYEFRSNMKKTGFTVLRPRFIKMDIIVDKKLFDYMGSDTKVVLQKVIQIIGFVNTIFEERPASTGALYPGSLCKLEYNSAVALYPKGLSLESFSVIVLQLLSIGMGLTYDTDNCHCTGDVCLMTPKAIYSGGMKDFSTCSLDDFKYLSTRQDLGCLQDLPLEERRKKQRRPRRICGNGIMEMNEQCDCGTLKKLHTQEMLRPHVMQIKAQGRMWFRGVLFSRLREIKPSDVLCRKSVDECDFMEYCNGRDAYCVPNTYARDGQYCDSGQAFCFRGFCQTSNKQCMDLLGKYVRGASFACYEEFNSRGDRFGNCIKKFCNFHNVLCGKLICTWPFKRLVKKVNISAAYSQVRDDLCVSTFKGGKVFKPTVTTYADLSDRDETFVKDGTICGPDMTLRECDDCMLIGRAFSADL